MANLDEQTTKSNDPKLIAARLFIGNLPSERVTKEELAMKFEKYGQVIGVSINKGFGFVQYETETEAHRGAKELNKLSLKGNILDVKLAGQGKKIQLDGGHASRKRHYDDDSMRIRDDRRRDRDLPPYHDNMPPLLANRSPPPGQFPPIGPTLTNECTILPSFNLPPPGHFMAQAPPSNGIPFRPEIFRDELFAPPTVPPPNTVATPAPPPSEDTHSSKKVEQRMERPFDAVIVVTEKSLKHYAEMVERRLLELNMVVDMIFLLNEKALNKAIDDMTCRGVLYIIVVQIEHEEHKSITVNIMHGSPQEHRNIPLDDALIMLARNFNAYLSGLRCGNEQPTMGFMLNLLADGKNLTVAELDRIIAHLQDRRDRMIEAEGGRNELSPSSSDSTVALQQKILSLVSGVLLGTANLPAGPPAKVGGFGSASGPSQLPTAAMNNFVQQFNVSFNSQLPLNGPVGLQSQVVGPLGMQQAPVPPHLGSVNVKPPTPLNFSDPNLIKALDNLMQTPSIFKSLNQPPPLAQQLQTPISTSTGQTFTLPPQVATNMGQGYGRK